MDAPDVVDAEVQQSLLDDRYNLIRVVTGVIIVLLIAIFVLLISVLFLPEYLNRIVVAFIAMYVVICLIEIFTNSKRLKNHISELSACQNDFEILQRRYDVIRRYPYIGEDKWRPEPYRQIDNGVENVVIDLNKSVQYIAELHHTAVRHLIRAARIQERLKFGSLFTTIVYLISVFFIITLMVSMQMASRSIRHIRAEIKKVYNLFETFKEYRRVELRKYQEVSSVISSAEIELDKIYEMYRQEAQRTINGLDNIIESIRQLRLYLFSAKDTLFNVDPSDWRKVVDAYNIYLNAQLTMNNILDELREIANIRELKDQAVQLFDDSLDEFKSTIDLATAQYKEIDISSSVNMYNRLVAEIRELKSLPSGPSAYQYVLNVTDELLENTTSAHQDLQKKIEIYHSIEVVSRQLEALQNEIPFYGKCKFDETINTIQETRILLLEAIELSKGIESDALSNAQGFVLNALARATSAREYFDESVSAYKEILNYQQIEVLLHEIETVFMEFATMVDLDDLAKRAGLRYADAYAFANYLKGIQLYEESSLRQLRDDYRIVSDLVIISTNYFMEKLDSAIEGISETISQDRLSLLAWSCLQGEAGIGSIERNINHAKSLATNLKAMDSIDIAAITSLRSVARTALNEQQKSQQISRRLSRINMRINDINSLISELGVDTSQPLHIEVDPKLKNVHDRLNLAQLEISFDDAYSILNEIYKDLQNDKNNLHIDNLANRPSFVTYSATVYENSGTLAQGTNQQVSQNIFDSGDNNAFTSV
jgi:Ca2+/Na+ antiporter